MRLTSLAAGIFTLAVAAYPVATTIASRASAAPGRAFAASQESSPPGPMGGGARDDIPQTDQDQPSQQLPQSSQPLQVATTVVNVFATVRDRHNEILSDLTKDDFRISEDGVQQKVSYFSKEVNLPITLALLMDTSYSMHNILVAEQDAASRFVSEVLRKRDEALVISFDTDINLLADFTQDPSVLDRAIHRATINVDAAGIGGTGGTIPSQGGGTDLYDAIYLACHDELSNEAGRKAIVLLTDAEDTGSKVSLGEAVEAAQRADTVIHVILITDSGETEGYGPGVASRMTSDTGGRVINVRNDKGLEKAFDEISEELRSQYVLGYYPSNPKRDGTFRRIKVDVDRPDLKILARKGYYAPAS
ncbi:MAG TPA: VWA domain-containing protein [Candidatus Acidoferrales bacterium]|jgi:VWFA-related protein|nr:VWA domain-containing protein [Candidatus Acidoferrales bacterium]